MTAKACTACGETKPLGAFHRRRSDSKERRAACKACAAKAAKYRSEHPPLLSQIVRHHTEPTAPLSVEAEAAIYTDKPLDPEMLRWFKKRQEAEARRLRRLKQEAQKNPMGLAARSYARMLGG